MRLNLKYQMVANYLIIVLLVVMISSFISNYLLEKHFMEYLTEKQQIVINNIVENINDQYIGNKNWNKAGLERIGLNALRDGIIVVIKDDQAMIWDAKSEEHSKYMNIIEQMEKKASLYKKGKYSNYNEKHYSLENFGNYHATVTLGYYGPFKLEEDDLNFIQKLNDGFFTVAIFSIFISLMMGYSSSKRMSASISNVIQATKRISEGNFEGKIRNHSKIKELFTLTDSINRLALKLRKQDDIRKKMSADIAHELRTPITTLQSHLEAMIDGVWDADEKTLISCYEEAVRLENLITSIDELQKLESENIKLDISKFNLISLINKTLMLFEADFINRTVTKSFEKDDVWIFADYEKIQRLLINLLSNAHKYSFDNAIIKLSLYISGNKVVVSVLNDGLGISNSDLDHVFERFYRGDKSRNSKIKGSGIGLTISQSIVEAHEGDIYITSKEGEWAEITFELPLYERGW